MKHIVLFSLALSILFASCKKDSVAPAQPGDTGNLELEFDNVVGSQDLQLNTGSYTNAAGEPYKVTTFKYYVSNIRLTATDGSVYTVPKDSSYFLVDEAAASKTIELTNIPANDYTGVSFVLGVDSLKNTAPVTARTGVLDPAGAGADMYWTWNQGYIFLKMEGVSPASGMANNSYMYHIGGFGGYSSATINNLKTINLTAPAGMSAKVRKDKPEAPEVHLFVDASKVLSGSTSVSIAVNPMVMFADYSVNIANNYATMFSINHIHNN